MVSLTARVPGILEVLEGVLYGISCLPAGAASHIGDVARPPACKGAGTPAARLRGTFVTAHHVDRLGLPGGDAFVFDGIAGMPWNRNVWALSSAVRASDS